VLEVSEIDVQPIPAGTPLEAACARYVAARPDALLYHSARWRDLLVDLLGAERRCLVARDAAGNVRGVLPALAAHGPWGTVLNSLPFYGSNGAVLADDAGVAAALVARWNALAEQREVAAATLVTNPIAEREVSGVIHDHVDRRIGQLTRIAGDGDPGERLMARFHQKTRNMIRKAERSGVTVRVDNDRLDFLREVHAHNLAALGGIAKPPRFFELLQRHFRADEDWRLWVARRAGEPVAALLTIYFAGTVEYYTPVVRVEHRRAQPMSLLVMEAMRDAAERGYRWWNWGGTWVTQDGVYRFKKRWGTQDREYLYYVKLNRRELLARDAQELLRAYPYFFVLPFHLLRVQGG